MKKNIKLFVEEKNLKFDEKKIIESNYRPFCKEFFYFGFNQRPGQIPKIFPKGDEKNFLICVNGVGGRKNFSVFITKKICDYHFNEYAQCFPKMSAIYLKKAQYGATE